MLLLPTHSCCDTPTHDKANKSKVLQIVICKLTPVQRICICTFRRAAEDYEDYDSNKVHMCTFLMCIVKCIAMIYLQANKVELVPGYGVYISSK